MLFLVQPLSRQGFVSPPHFPFVSFPSFEPLVLTQPHLTFEPLVLTWLHSTLKPSVPMQPHSTLLGFIGVKNDTFPGILHEFAKEDKGKELALGGFKSLPPIDA